ncbi:MAG TPA: transposase [Candidatus Paceibacterota bacterium]|nr:transposase [Candidatus Paceibacterota bacterium]
MEALYLSNSESILQRSSFQKRDHDHIMQLQRGKQIVDIAAYCMMPNHFHILLREMAEGGITKFMHKVGTSYTMYFNAKRGRTGNLFVKPFRSKYIADDRYFKRVVQYIHLNPAELFEKDWKTGNVLNLGKLEHHLRTYPFSSLYDYYGLSRNESAILGPIFPEVQNGLPMLKDLLEDSQSYYKNLR